MFSIAVPVYFFFQVKFRLKSISEIKISNPDLYTDHTNKTLLKEIFRYNL